MALRAVVSTGIWIREMRKPARRRAGETVNYTGDMGPAAGRPQPPTQLGRGVRRVEQDVVLAQRQELVGIQRDAFLAHLEVQVRAR